MRLIHTHRLAAATLLALLCASSLWAAPASPAADPARSDVPPPGPPGPPPPRDPKFAAAMEACAAERPGGDGPSRKGKRPDHAKFEACMAAKGFKRPPHPPGDHRGPPPPPPAGEADGGGN